MSNVQRSQAILLPFVPLLVFFYQQHLRKQKLKYANTLNGLLTHVLLVKKHQQRLESS